MTESWQDMLDVALTNNNESKDDIVMANISTPTDEWDTDHDDYGVAASFDRQFHSGFGGTEGDYFTVWTNDWVYFPICYDGAESVGRIRRNPTKDYTARHQGGGG